MQPHALRSCQAGGNQGCFVRMGRIPPCLHRPSRPRVGLASAAVSRVPAVQVHAETGHPFDDPLLRADGGGTGGGSQGDHGSGAAGDGASTGGGETSDPGREFSVDCCLCRGLSQPCVDNQGQRREYLRCTELDRQQEGGEDWQRGPLQLSRSEEQTAYEAV